MAIRRRDISADLAWLKWWIALLALSFAIAIGGYWAALYYRSDMQRLEMGTRSNFDVITQEVTQIEESERIIVENIDRYNALVSNRLLDNEDRVALLEDIRMIRNRYRLFPIDVEVREQSSKVLEYPERVENPEEQISVLTSVIQLRIPLLHEEDLTRFLRAFLNAGRLMVTTNCVIAASTNDESMSLEIMPNQVATCQFLWYTFKREVPSFDDEYGEFSD